MPFVLAHPAAVLPLRRFCGRFLSLPALILGSLAPDSAYVFGRMDVDGIAHRPIGGMVYSTITGLLVIGVLTLWPRVRKALPTRLVSRLPFPETIAWSWFPGIVFSLMLGALTHVLWDSFTHKEAWAVYRFPFLRLPVLEIGYRTVRVCHLLWYASSFLGITYVCLVYAGWRARNAPPHEAASPRTRFWSSVAFALVLIPRRGAASRHPRRLG
jgi:hypothetical protein